MPIVVVVVVFVVTWCGRDRWVVRDGIRKTNTRKEENVSITSAFKMNVIKYTQAAGLRLSLLTAAVLPDTVQPVMVTVPPETKIPPP